MIPASRLSVMPLSVLLFGCYRQDSTVTPPSVANRGRSVAIRSCPLPDALAARLRDAWDIAEPATVRVQCASGRFPEPGWFVQAIIEGVEDDQSESPVQRL